MPTSLAAGSTHYMDKISHAISRSVKPVRTGFPGRNENVFPTIGLKRKKCCGLSMAKKSSLDLQRDLLLHPDSLLPWHGGGVSCRRSTCRLAMYGQVFHTCRKEEIKKENRQALTCSLFPNGPVNQMQRDDLLILAKRETLRHIWLSRRHVNG